MEWWFWNPKTHVAHLRVTLTAFESTLVPPGVVTTDAGETGPPEARRQATRRKKP